MQNLQIPISIIIGGAIVASAIVFSGGGSNQAVVNEGQNGGDSFGNSNSATAKNVMPVDANRDHIIGDINAKVTVIEYSDFECPFCSRFHPTLESIIDDFGGEVAWVYRHFPLTSIHSSATGAAVASECVAELLGEDAFWKFTNEAFKNQKTLGNDFYLSAAISLGATESDFTSCINSGRYDQKIAEDTNNAIESGGRGTPFSIVLNDKGEVFPFSGALPYENVRSVVEQALGR
jgi:protein-disulfide isomerase